MFNMKQNFWVIIPARHASSRLPAKPLLLINGQPMMQHVYQKAQASGATRVLIATDDVRIQQAAQAFGADVLMTASSHLSGTDRVAEAARLAGASSEQIIVNLQVDEPLIAPALLQQVASALAESNALMATVSEVADDVQLNDAHVVKVVCDNQGFALYFSRAAIPFLRDAKPRQTPVMRHIGLYAYRNHYLQRFISYPQAPIEQDEALEQLRALTQGDKILVVTACAKAGIGVDTAADLAKVRHYFEQPHD